MSIITVQNVKTGFTFFSDTVSFVNSKRLKLRQTKGFASLVARKAGWKKNNLPQWDPILGISSFALYQARIVSNLGLLMCTLISDDNEEIKQSILEEIMLTLVNDIVWSTINLIQYFWWTFKVSLEAGFRGMYLESVGMLFDTFVMLIQFIQGLVQHQQQLANFTAEQRDYHRLDWTYQTINLIRSSLHMVSLAMLFTGFALGFVAFPISIFVYSVNITSNSLRISFEIIKNKQKTTLMRQHGVNEDSISAHEQRIQLSAVEQINHFLHLLIFIPLILILFAPTPFALSVSMIIVVIISDYLIDQWIHSYQPTNAESSEAGSIEINSDETIGSVEKICQRNESPNLVDEAPPSLTFGYPS